jgi:hypothetical protein
MKCRIHTNIPGEQWLDWVDVDIEPEDRVKLMWYGDQNIPKRLGYTWATVQSITQKGHLIVMCDADAHGTRSIVPERHVRTLQKKGNGC